MRLGQRPKEGEKAQYYVQFDDGKSMIQYLDDNGKEKEIQRYKDLNE